MSLLPAYMSDAWKCYETMAREDRASLDPTLISADPETCHLDILPFLAWEADIDISGLSTTAKRGVIAAAFKSARYAGTAQSIVDIVDGFAADATVEEWFDYAGTAFHFRVLINAIGIVYSAEDLAWLEATVNKRKNVRSVLDSIEVQASIDPAIMYMGGVSSSFEIITLELVA
jgi:phage tail P2-like protein